MHRLCLLLLFAAIAFAQTPAAFEVATIRVHSFATDSVNGPPLTGNRFALSGNINQLVIYAYDLKSYQVEGGPDWVAHPSTDGDYYDIRAKAEGDEALTESRALQLLQTLLAERFQVKLHRERRELPVYVLVVGKGGPKFQESTAEEGARPRAARSSTQSGFVSTMFLKSPMDMVARVIAGAADRPILDETGLTGFYDLKLEFARDPSAVALADGPPSIFTAVQEQLGLKLEAEKRPIEMFVIDAAARPSEN
jgi:uncharacterized protein (TIGR03435 family)